MTENEKARAWFEEGFAAIGKRLLRLAALALLVYIVVMSRTIVITLIMAGILACAASGPMAFLYRQPWLSFLKPHGRRAATAGIVLIFIVGFTAGAIVLFLHPIQSELKNLQKNWPEKYQPVIARKLEETKQWYATQPDWVHKQVPSWLDNALSAQKEDDHPANHDPAVPPSPPASTSEEKQNPAMAASAGSLVLGFLGKLGGLLNGIVELILLPVLAFYFLVEGHDLRNELVRFVPLGKRRVTLALLRESASIMQAYLVAQLMLASIAGVFVGTMLGVLHIPYALVLALVAAVTRAIPVIGPLLGGIPVGVIVFVECSRQGNYALLGVVMFLFTLMHLLESKALTPIILGKGLNLHPIIVIIALLLGGQFFGLMGMFLAAPVTALIRTFLMHLYIHPQQTHHRATSRLARALATKKDP